jgi:hypothetical protein
VHLAHLRLRDFRNYARLDADFSPGFHLLLGDNAQGKTNILEAIYLMATLRSFRGVGGAQMIRHGRRAISSAATSWGRASHEIKMYWSARERKLALDGQPVKKLADYFGALRTVVFCTEDLQLVKGAARARRRFLDLLLAQTHPVICRCSSVTCTPCAPATRCSSSVPGRGGAGQFFAGTGEARQRNHPRPPRTGAEIFAAGAAGVSAHLQRRGGIAHRISAEREKGFRRGTGAIAPRANGRIAPRWSGRTATICNCCSTKNPPRSSAAKGRSARWPSR